MALASWLSPFAKTPVVREDTVASTPPLYWLNPVIRVGVFSFIIVSPAFNWPLPAESLPTASLMLEKPLIVPSSSEESLFTSNLSSWVWM